MWLNINYKDNKFHIHHSQNLLTSGRLLCVSPLYADDGNKACSICGIFELQLEMSHLHIHCCQNSQISLTPNCLRIYSKLTVMHLNRQDLKIERTGHILINIQPYTTFKHCQTTPSPSSDHSLGICPFICLWIIHFNRAQAVPSITTACCKHQPVHGTDTRLVAPWKAKSCPSNQVLHPKSRKISVCPARVIQHV